MELALIGIAALLTAGLTLFSGFGLVTILMPVFALFFPVPLAIGLRWALGLPFRLATLPLFVAAFFGGQFLGARLRRR